MVAMCIIVILIARIGKPDDRKPIEVTPKNDKGWVDIQEFVSSGVC